MKNNGNITNIDQLEFVIFCIENIAIKIGKQAEDVYNILTKQSDILDNYIIPGYEVLHTQSKEYIVDDIVSYMREKGIKL